MHLDSAKPFKRKLDIMQKCSRERLPGLIIKNDELSKKDQIDFLFNFRECTTCIDADSDNNFFVNKLIMCFRFASL